MEKFHNFSVDKTPSMTDILFVKLIFRETSVFTKQINELLGEEELNALQWVLMADPEKGDLSPAQIKILKTIIETEYP